MPTGPESDRWGRVPVHCFGRTWWLQDVPAFTWIMAYKSDEMSEVFPGLTDLDDAEDLYRLWLDVPDMRRRAENVARVAFGRASGREWYWAGNLVDESLKSWTYINGMLVRQGVRATETSLPDWLDASYTLMRELMDEKGRTALDIRLRRIPRDALTTMRPTFSNRSALLAFAAD